MNSKVIGDIGIWEVRRERLVHVYVQGDRKTCSL